MIHLIHHEAINTSIYSSVYDTFIPEKRTKLSVFLIITLSNLYCKEVLYTVYPLYIRKEKPKCSILFRAYVKAV